MKIKIHRGQNQIGGSIIEISSETTKIILDAGSELDEEIPQAPQIDGLFCGEAKYDAVFISHYHGDHLGLCEQVLQGIPIYIGKGAGEVTNAARRYLNKPEYKFSSYYESGKTMQIGDISITPYLCDHSAFDSHMFHIVCGDKSVIYSGDFRSNGRKSFPYLLKRLPAADILIVEGTTLSRASQKQISEKELEEIAVGEIKNIDTPVFVLMAATNIDRLVTIFKATKRCKRTLVEDLYLAEVSSAAGENIPNPITFSGIRVFLTHGYNGRYDLLNEKYEKTKISRSDTAKQSFVMCVRPSMKSYLEKLSDETSFNGGVLFYSMWEGYREKEDINDFLEFMRSKGVSIINLHTSGHADAETIDKLVVDVNPSIIIPVHTKNAAWFERYSDIRIVNDTEYIV